MEPIWTRLRDMADEVQAEGFNFTAAELRRTAKDLKRRHPHRTWDPNESE